MIQVKRREETMFSSLKVESTDIHRTNNVGLTILRLQR